MRSSRPTLVWTLIGALSLILTPAAHAAGGGGRTLQAGSGGTGISKSGGSGGTGLSSHGSTGGGRTGYKGIGANSPTRATNPISNTQQVMVPAKPFTPPQAGVLQHTDLAAATKSIALSSRGLVKHSQLFPKVAAPPGDPNLSGPVLNAIGPQTGGSASFRAVQGFTAQESNANIYPSNMRGASSKLPTNSLWGGSSSTVPTNSQASDEAISDSPNRQQGWIINALTNAACLVGILLLGFWMWRQAPTRPRLVARLAPV